jgi:hypothetical protein
MTVRELIEMLAKENWDAEVHITDNLTPKCRSVVPKAESISSFRQACKPIIVIKP